ncbi:MAG: hypothetical protein EZS28_014420 [Streblomastix strix]|uniref:Uncharacterized protein n=1 Tax=Streblomastix strix TaxID=222440 RepID=A0A5J4W6C5_9EUKA|nr:MAG: hypothetical protein EZS28_014420 [Streblomastix strix]
MYRYDNLPFRCELTELVSKIRAATRQSELERRKYFRSNSSVHVGVTWETTQFYRSVTLITTIGRKYADV